MKRILLAAAFVFADAGAAFAHAQLQSASPPVGATVSPPGEIRLTFSEGVEPKFCGVTVVSASGAAQAVGRPSVAPGNDKTLVVRLGKTLAPGAHTVKWRAVSVDMHRTQGEFDFTVK